MSTYPCNCSPGDPCRPQSYFLPSLCRYGLIAPRTPGVDSVHSAYDCGPATVPCAAIAVRRPVLPAAMRGLRSMRTGGWGRAAGEPDCEPRNARPRALHRRPRSAHDVQQRRLLARRVFRPAVRLVRRARRLRRQVSQPDAAAAHRMGLSALRHRPRAAAVARLRADQPVAAAVLSVRRLPRRRRVQRPERQRQRRARQPPEPRVGLVAHVDRAVPHVHRPAPRRQRFPTRQFDNGDVQVLRRARLLRRRYRHRVLRRRPRLHARRLDRQIRPVRYARHGRPDSARVPERRVDGRRDRRRRRDDSGPQQSAARLVELRRHVLRRLRPGHEPGVRKQPGRRERLRRHHDHRSQGRLHRTRLRLPRRHGQPGPQLQQRRHLVHAAVSESASPTRCA